MPSWRDISTAPRDGRWILAWTPEGHDLVTFSETVEDGLQEMGHDAGYWGLLTGADPGRSMGNPAYKREPCNQPTHWMPLPEPPDTLESEDCQHCDGYGHIGGLTCCYCRGTGYADIPAEPSSEGSAVVSDSHDPAAGNSRNNTRKG